MSVLLVLHLKSLVTHLAMLTEQSTSKLKFVASVVTRQVVMAPSLPQVRQNTTDVNYHILQYTAVIADLQEEITRLRRKSHEPENFLSLPQGKRVQSCTLLSKAVCSVYHTSHGAWRTLVISPYILLMTCFLGTHLQ